MIRPPSMAMQWTDIPDPVRKMLEDAGLTTAEEILEHHEAMVYHGREGLQVYPGIGPAYEERILAEANQRIEEYWQALGTEQPGEAPGLSPGVMERLQHPSEEPAPPRAVEPTTALTPRERAINEAMELGLTREESAEVLAGHPVDKMNMQALRTVLRAHAARDIGHPPDPAARGIDYTRDEWRGLTPSGRARARETVPYPHGAAGAAREGYITLGPRPHTQFHQEKALAGTHWAVREGKIHTGLDDPADYPGRIKQAIRAYQRLHFTDAPVQEAGWRLGPGADVPEEGHPLRTALIFGNLLPEGQVLFSQELGDLERPELRTVRAEVPKDFDVKGLVEKGARWFRDDEPLKLFEGHTGVEFRQWDYAEVRDISYTPGEEGDPGVVRAQMALGKRAGRIFGARTPTTKGGGVQVDLGTAFGGAFEGYGAVMSGAPRDRMGLAQMVWAATDEETFRGLTGRDKPEFWQDMGPELTQTLVEQLGDPKVYDVPMMLSEEQLDWYQEAAEERIIGEPQPIGAPGIGGHWLATMRYYGYDLPMLWTMTDEGAVEWGEHFIPPETLRMFEKHTPETAAQWHRESEAYKRDLTAIIQADVATTGRGAVPEAVAEGAVDVDAMQIIERATAAAREDFPESGLERISPAMRAGYILEQVPEDLDYLTVTPPGSERTYYFPHPRHIPHVPGDIVGEEFSPYRAGLADVIRRQAEISAGLEDEQAVQDLRDAVARTYRAQHEQAWAPETRRKLLGVRPEAMWGGTFTAHRSVRPGDVWMPTREAAMAMGVPTRGKQFEGFAREFESGRLEPPVWTVPYPTLTEDSAMIPSVMRPLKQHPLEELRGLQTPVLNPAHTAAMQRDVDTDDILIARAFGVSPEQVRDRRQAWLEAGAAEPSGNVARAISKIARFSTPEEVQEWMAQPGATFTSEEGRETLEQDALARLAIGYGANIRQELVTAAPFPEAEEAGRWVGALMQQEALGGQAWGEAFTRLAAFRSASLSGGGGYHSIALEGEEGRWLGGEIRGAAGLPGEMVRITQGLAEEGILSEEAAASLLVPSADLVEQGVEVIRGERHIRDIGGEGQYTLEGIARSALGGVVIGQAAAREGRMSEEVQEIGRKLLDIRKASRGRTDVRVEETLEGMYRRGSTLRDLALQAGFRPSAPRDIAPEEIERPVERGLPEGLERMFRPSHVGQPLESLIASAMDIPTAESVAGTLIHEQVGRLLGIEEQEVTGTIAGQEMAGHLDLPIAGAGAFVDIKTGHPRYAKQHAGQMRAYSALTGGDVPYIMRRDPTAHGEMQDLWGLIGPGMTEIQQRMAAGEELGIEKDIGIEDLPEVAQEPLRAIAQELADTFRAGEAAIRAGEDPGERFVRIEPDVELAEQEAAQLIDRIHEFQELVSGTAPEDIPETLRAAFLEGEMPTRFRDLMDAFETQAGGAGGGGGGEGRTRAAAPATDPPGRPSWIGQVTPRKFEESLEYARATLDSFAEATGDLESGARKLDKNFIQSNRTFKDWIDTIDRVNKGWGIAPSIGPEHRDVASQFIFEHQPLVQATRQIDRYARLMEFGQGLGVTPPGVPPGMIPGTAAERAGISPAALGYLGRASQEDLLRMGAPPTLAQRVGEVQAAQRAGDWAWGDLPEEFTDVMREASDEFLWWQSGGGEAILGGVQGLAQAPVTPLNIGAISQMHRTLGSNLAPLFEAGLAPPEWRDVLTETSAELHEQQKLMTERQLQAEIATAETNVEQLGLSAWDAKEALDRFIPTLDEANRLQQEGQKLTKEQHAAFRAMGPVAKVLEKAYMAGVPARRVDPDTGERVEQPVTPEMMRQVAEYRGFAERLTMSAAAEGAQEGLLGGLGYGIKRMAVGFAPFQMRRAWSMLGAPVFREYIPAAAGAELAAWQASIAMDEGAPGMPGDVAAGVMRMRGLQQQARVDAGRMGYRAWGGAMQAGAGVMPGVQSVAGPPAAIALATLVAGMVLGGPLGLTTGAVLAISGGILGTGTGIGIGNVLTSYGAPTAENQIAAAEAGRWGTIRAAVGALSRPDKPWYVPGHFSTLAYPRETIERVQEALLQGPEGERILGTPLGDLQGAERIAAISQVAKQLRGQKGTIWEGMDEPDIVQALMSYMAYTDELSALATTDFPARMPQWITRAITEQIDIGQFEQLAAGMGMGVTGAEQLTRMAPSGTRQRREWTMAMQQWSPLIQMGMSGEQLAEMTQEGWRVARVGMPPVQDVPPLLQPLEGADKLFRDQLLAGDQQAWSTLALHGGTFPGTDFRMPATPGLVSVGPAGLPIGTTTPLPYGRPLTGRAPRPDVVGATPTSPQVAGFQDLYADAAQRIAHGQATGEWIGGWHPLSMWGLQDRMTAESRRYQDVQFGIQGAQAAAQRRYYQQLWPLQDEMIALAHAQQVGGMFGDRMYTGQFAFQRRQAEMGLGFTMAGIGISRRELGLTRQQADMQRQWQAADYQWQLEELGISREQALTQRGWAREDWGRERAISAREFGWRMEDYEEDIRFAVGRQRQRLVTEQERDVVRYADERSQFETEKDRQEQIWRWEDQAHERRLERMAEMRDREERIADIQEQRFNLQEERINLQEQQAQESHALSMEQLEEQMAAYLERYDLEEQQRELSREHQLEMLSLQEAAAGAAKEHAENMRELEDAYREAERGQQILLSEWQRLMVRAIIEMLKAMDADVSEVIGYYYQLYGTEDPIPRRGPHAD